LDQLFLDQLTNAICALSEGPSDGPSDLPANVECAANCGSYFTGSPAEVCGNAEGALGCVRGDCPDNPAVIDFFQGIVDQACATLPEPFPDPSDLPANLACAANCGGYFTGNPADVCWNGQAAMGCVRDDCTDNPDVIDFFQGIVDQACALPDPSDLPANLACAANCGGNFADSPAEVCGNAESTLECVKADCTDDPDVVGLFQRVVDQACALPEPPACAQKCPSAAMPNPEGGGGGGGVADPVALPCDTATAFASCLETECGDEDPLTDLASQLQDIACVTVHTK
jgi:hypothetical protein